MEPEDVEEEEPFAESDYVYPIAARRFYTVGVRGPDPRKVLSPPPPHTAPPYNPNPRPPLQAPGKGKGKGKGKGGKSQKSGKGEKNQKSGKGKKSSNQTTSNAPASTSSSSHVLENMHNASAQPQSPTWDPPLYTSEGDLHCHKVKWCQMTDGQW